MNNQQRTTDNGPRTKSKSASEVRLVEVLDAYLAAAQEGTAPARNVLLAEYPELAEDLEACLASLEFIRQASLTAPVSVPDAKPAAGSEGEVGIGDLGDFRLIAEVGRGGMGVVYEAMQRSLNRRVALKVLPFAAAMDPTQLRRFQTEALAAAQLHHTHIVPVYSVGCERGVHYYAMQFIEGQTLAQAIAERRRSEAPPPPVPPSPPVWEGGPKGRMGVGAPSPLVGEGAPQGRMGGAPAPPNPDSAETRYIRSSAPTPSSRTREYCRTAAALGIQAAVALDHAHTFGIVHRDIKPANLLLDVQGNLWITDFGLARLSDDAGLTITGDLLGTLRYMSPEQALAKRGYLDHRTDIYSLGATLYELVTLRPAIDGQDRQEVLRKLAHDEPTPPRHFNAAIPRELETILLKAMNKEPGSRYVTARELADDLKRFLEHKPIKAKRPTGFEQVAKWVRRHPSIVIAALATLLTTAFILAIAIVLIAREQVATQEALQRLKDEQQNATRYAATAKKQSDRAGLRLAIALQSVESILLRLSDGSLPNVPQIQELRRSFEQHAQKTIEGLVDASNRDPEALAEAVLAYNHLAGFYFLSGRIEEWRATSLRTNRLTDQLVNLNPRDSSCLLQLGNYHNAFALQLHASGLRTEATDEFHQAYSAYLRALALDPANFESLRRLRWFLAICPEPQFRDPNRVLELTAQMIEQEKLPGPVRPWDPSRSPHWLVRGVAFYRNNAFTSAIATLQVPLQAELPRKESLYGAGDVVLGCFVLSMAYQRTGDRARALYSYRTAVRLMETSQPRNAEGMIFRAEAAALLGLTEQPAPTGKKGRVTPKLSSG